MLDLEILQQIKKAPVAERLELVELILRSLRNDITEDQQMRKKSKRFKIRKFNLGGEIHIDRDELYSDRG